MINCRAHLKFWSILSLPEELRFFSSVRCLSSCLSSCFICGWAGLKFGFSFCKIKQFLLHSYFECVTLAWSYMKVWSVFFARSPLFHGFWLQFLLLWDWLLTSEPLGSMKFTDRQIPIGKERFKYWIHFNVLFFSFGSWLFWS